MQACHFVDLACYLSFGSEIERESVQSTAVGPDYPLADMPPHPHGEHLVGPCILVLDTRAHVILAAKVLTCTASLLQSHGVRSNDARSAPRCG